MSNNYLSNIIHNVDQLISITKHIKKESAVTVTYKKEIKILNITFRKAGFYDGYGVLREKEELESGCYLIEDNIVFLKPYLELRFIDDPYNLKYFDTVEEMEQFIIKLTTNKNFVDLENKIQITI